MTTRTNLSRMLVFLAGWLAAIPPGASPAGAEMNRIFELRIYHVMPGKLPVMEARFRDTTSKLLVRHHLDVVGYWTTADSSGADTTFVFLLAHRSREEARQNWNAMRLDPEFQAVLQAERSERTLRRADVFFMPPTDFSPMK